MPMIDAYAAAGTFADKHQLAVDLATAVMTIEQVPDIPMFRKNTAAFVHDLPVDSLANVDGDSNYVRVQVLTNSGALDREKQLTVNQRLHQLLAEEQPYTFLWTLTNYAAIHKKVRHVELHPFKLFTFADTWYIAKKEQ